MDLNLKGYELKKASQNYLTMKAVSVKTTECPISEKLVVRPLNRSPRYEVKGNIRTYLLLFAYSAF